MSIIDTLYGLSLHLHLFDRLETRAREENCSLQVQYPGLKRSTTHKAWERKSTKKMAFVLGVYLTCWVPSAVFYSVLRPADFLFRRIQPWINSVYYLGPYWMLSFTAYAVKRFVGKWQDWSISCAPWTRFVPNDMWKNLNVEVKK